MFGFIDWLKEHALIVDLLFFMVVLTNVVVGIRMQKWVEKDCEKRAGYIGYYMNFIGMFSLLLGIIIGIGLSGQFQEP